MRLLLTVLLILPALLHAQTGLHLEAVMATPVLESGKAQRAYLKVGLSGDTGWSVAQRAPVNVALVIDKSSSMRGENILRAREAAQRVLDQLKDCDVISVIAYADAAEVIVPATKLTDRAAIRERIASIEAKGDTALFAGLSKAAAEVRKFADPNRVNRIVLLSDGRANIGPSSPGELGLLGSKLMKEGIATTTIGLGDAYNEDLMCELALKSDGNHANVQDPARLNDVFRLEIGDLLSVVAKDVWVEINCAPGVKPLRLLGRDAVIHGQRIVVPINQIYSRQEKFVVVEVELPAGDPGSKRLVATTRSRYLDMASRENVSSLKEVYASFSDQPKVVAEKVNLSALVCSISLDVNETKKQAVVLRDSGNHEAAKDLLQASAFSCGAQATALGCPNLKNMGDACLTQSAWVEQTVSESQWNLYRKKMQREWVAKKTMQGW